MRLSAWAIALCLLIMIPPLVPPTAEGLDPSYAPSPLNLLRNWDVEEWAVNPDYGVLLPVSWDPTPGSDAAMITRRWRWDFTRNPWDPSPPPSGCPATAYTGNYTIRFGPSLSRLGIQQRVDGVVEGATYKFKIHARSIEETTVYMSVHWLSSTGSEVGSAFEYQYVLVKEPDLNAFPYGRWRTIVVVTDLVPNGAVSATVMIEKVGLKFADLDTLDFAQVSGQIPLLLDLTSERGGRGREVPSGPVPASPEIVLTASASIPGKPLAGVPISMELSDADGHMISSFSMPTDVNGDAKFVLPGDSLPEGSYTARASLELLGQSTDDVLHFDVVRVTGELSIMGVELLDANGVARHSFSRSEHGRLGVTVMNRNDDIDSSLLTAMLLDGQTPLDLRYAQPGEIPLGLNLLEVGFEVPAQASSTLTFYTALFSDWPSLGGTPLSNGEVVQAAVI